ncbi:hypothetical protein RJ641_001673 [Dillenia turbinata]|uniref:Uncharacterized protein n=1 Tax=Dillenia turbinata TaxID=194707 RepID=A0AAN8VEI3_9MAGN
MILSLMAVFFRHGNYRLKEKCNGVLDLLVEAEVLRCIHVDQLCVQEFAKDRPTVYALLAMLNSEVAHLPAPKLTGFVQRHVLMLRHTTRLELETPKQEFCTFRGYPSSIISQLTGNWGGGRRQRREEELRAK